MKLPARLTKEEKRAKYGKWHLHFAFWPVRVGTGESRWLEKVFRKLDLSHPKVVVYGMNTWLYRSYEDGIFAALQEEPNDTIDVGQFVGQSGVTTINIPPDPAGQSLTITTLGSGGGGAGGSGHIITKGIMQPYYIGSCSGSDGQPI